MGKKKSIIPLETTAIRLEDLENSDAIAEENPIIGLRLIEMTEKEQENRQQLRLKLLEIEKIRQEKVLGDRRLMQVFGFILAIIALITGSLIPIFNQQREGAIAGISLGVMGILGYLVLQICLLQREKESFLSESSINPVVAEN